MRFRRKDIGESMKWRLEDESELMTPIAKKNKIIIGLVICVVMIVVFVADDWQQKRFATLRHGYYSMEQHKYEIAAVDFKEYLDVDSGLYWYLLEHINNNDDYSRKKVKECLDECTSLQEQTYQGGM